MCVCVVEYRCVEAQKLELELQGVMSCQIWVLRTKPWSSASATSALNSYLIYFLAPRLLLAYDMRVT